MKKSKLIATGCTWIVAGYLIKQFICLVLAIVDHLDLAWYHDPYHTGNLIMSVAIEFINNCNTMGLTIMGAMISFAVTLFALLFVANITADINKA